MTLEYLCARGAQLYTDSLAGHSLTLASHTQGAAPRTGSGNAKWPTLLIHFRVFIPLFRSHNMLSVYLLVYRDTLEGRIRASANFPRTLEK